MTWLDLCESGYRRLGMWVLVSLLLLPLGLVMQSSWNVQQVMAAVKTQLPQRISEVLSDVYRDQQPQTLFLQRINEDLQWSSGSPVCSVSLSDSDLVGFWPRLNQLSVNWQLGGQVYPSVFEVSCRIHWPRLILSVALSAGVLVLLLGLMPQTLRPKRASWLKALLQQGERWFGACESSLLVDGFNSQQQILLSRLVDEHQIDLKTALNLVARPELRQLDDSQVEWFLLGLSHSQGDIAAAQAIALSDQGLLFKPHEGLVYAHGMAIKLSKTPYFYYLWYARLRASDRDEGWYINPAVNRPDLLAADELMELMADFSGHGKAINDLQQHGLRAKTLDQNRNKIKDELLASLGETLAGNYLFETERDLKSGRSRYRLALAAPKITFTQSRNQDTKPNKNIKLVI